MMRLHTQLLTIWGWQGKDAKTKTAAKPSDSLIPIFLCVVNCLRNAKDSTLVLVRIWKKGTTRWWHGADLIDVSMILTFVRRSTAFLFSPSRQGYPASN
jgi:hypothetical protein